MRKRFPTMEHVVKAGLITEAEAKLMERPSAGYSGNKWWMPLVWATKIVDMVRRRNPFQGECLLPTIVQNGGLYFAKTDSAKSENQYRNLVNRILPNQESDKPYSVKTYSGIC